MKIYSFQDHQPCPEYPWGGLVDVWEGIERKDCPGCTWDDPVLPINQSIRVSIQGRVWPDQFFGGGQFLSARAVEKILDAGAKLDIYPVTLSSDSQIDRRITGIRPDYYLARPVERLKLDWSDSEIPEPALCRVCGRYNVEPMSPERFAVHRRGRFVAGTGGFPLVFGRWGSSDSELYCTEDFIRLAASNGWRNFCFMENSPGYTPQIPHWEWPEYHEDEELKSIVVRSVDWGEQHLKRWKTQAKDVIKVLSEISGKKLKLGHPDAFLMIDTIVNGGLERIPPNLSAMIQDGDVMQSFVAGMHAALKCGLFWPFPERIAEEEIESAFLDDGDEGDRIDFRHEMELWNKGRGVSMKDLFLIELQ